MTRKRPIPQLLEKKEKTFHETDPVPFFSLPRAFFCFSVLSAPGSWREQPLSTPVLAQRTGSFNLHSMGGPGGRNTAQRQSLGEEPSPLDLSHVRLPCISPVIGAGGDVSPAAVSFPFILRSPPEGRMTYTGPERPTEPVRPSGALLPGVLFLRRPRKEQVLPEWHLALFRLRGRRGGTARIHRNTDPIFGGRPHFSTGKRCGCPAALLARWTGAVAEADRPTRTSPPGRRKAGPSLRTGRRRGWSMSSTSARRPIWTA